MNSLRKLGFALMVLCILTNANAQKCSSSIKEDNFGIIHGDMNNNFFINNPCEFVGAAFINVYSSVKRPEVTLLSNNGIYYAPKINSPVDSLIGQIIIPGNMPYNQSYFSQNILKIVDLDNPLSICEIPFTFTNFGCGAVKNIRTHKQVCPERNGKISFEVGLPGKLELLTNYSNDVVFSKEYNGGFKLDTITGLKNQVYRLRFTINNGVPIIYGYYSPYSNSLDFNLLVDISKPSTIEITGKDAVCVGNTSNLIPSVTGGVWSSSSNIKATVTNGTLKGVSAGTTMISYSLGKDECLVSGSKLVTVESLPVASITGPSKICWNGKAMFKSSVAGGVWAPINSALLLSSSQGLFRNGTQPSVDNFKSGVSYTLTSKLGSCVTKVVKNVYIRNVISPSVVVSSPKTTIKLNEVITATSTTTNPANGTWSSTNTLISVTANTSNTKTASVKGLRVGTGSNVVYFADDAATGCRFLNWLAINVTAAQSIVDNQPDFTMPSGVNVYPNPTKGNLTIENLAGAQTISLVDMTGRIIKSVPVNSDSMNVNFSGVQGGKYLVQIAGEQLNEMRSIVIE
ncbi:MAG: T9SS C-terminal target domain-containing protein [Crocinitomicaceae bacterium]|nr:T9SS C-terminal target domain-containing protein [Crocinitomicaceae bacterium]